MGALLSAQKGRPSAPGQRRVGRQLATIFLSWNVQLCLRRVPSEKNVTDEPPPRAALCSSEG
eukprot:8087583-Pyramimonas_sp.AAC.1